MGCTSSNPKRTTSIDDVSGKQKEPFTPNKNGQLGQEKVVKRKDHGSSPPNDSSQPLQIPGTHKSFLAPDGIPFIDDDVDSDAEDQVIANAKTGPPDQNKNTIGTKIEVGGGDTSALPVAHHVEVKAAVVESHHEPPVVRAASHPDSQVVADIKQLEARLNASEPTRDDVKNTDATSPTSRQVPADTGLPVKEEIAATKIQAGIRGFLDRKKVKAIKASKSQTADSSQINVNLHTDHSPEKPPRAIQNEIPENTFEHNDTGFSSETHGGEPASMSFTDEVIAAIRSDEPAADVNNSYHTTQHGGDIHTENFDGYQVESQNEGSYGNEDQGFSIGGGVEDHHHGPVKIHVEEHHDPRLDQAAIKIQAQYKGYKTRKSLNMTKK